MRPTSFAFALFFAGCLSPLENTAPVDLYGKLALPDGNPAADAKVVLYKADAAQGLKFANSGGLGARSRGSACAQGLDLDFCKAPKDTTAGSDGGFHFSLKGSDVNDATGAPAFMNATSTLSPPSGAARGAVVDVAFTVTKSPFDLGDLRFYAPENLAATAAADKLVVTYALAPGKDQSSHAVLVTAQDGAIVWAQRVASGEAIDARAIEDVDGAVHVEQHQLVNGVGTVTLETPALPVTGKAGKPLSRGRDCFVPDPAGKQVAVPSCALTNGKFGDILPAQAACSDTSKPCPSNSAVAIDLGAVASVSAVFLHAFPGAVQGLVLETSEDGTTWTGRGTIPAGTQLASSHSFAAVVLQTPASARWVRVRSETGTVANLAELSVW